MNYTIAAFLANNDVRAIETIYEAGDDAKRTVFKSLDPDLAVDDYVVVPTHTRHKMTVVKVVAVDVEPPVDTDKEIGWIIGKVDRANFEDIEKQEADAVRMLRAHELRTRKEEMWEKMKMARAGADLKTLPIYSKMGSEPDNSGSDTADT